ncbi:uncharacterized protein LOC107694003 [Sinocyclocheilus anshuiensis]|uniref:uncharacterized protein LOC107694003 n=1 Tax=Sinocyclocheilus anshuiensis TaxID=1608454 RepID=UPI0007B94A7C|nr:PREDICTED: uncharacterized protein LOC107694003 [Sinocyclocheilus anshuiensis]
MAGYSLKNKFIVSLFAVFAFFMHGASDVGTDRVSVIVMKGDSVTLHTNITINQQYRVKWYFIDTLVAQHNLSHICTDVQCHEDNERFRDRLELGHQTGDLTITNINTSDNGVYHLKIFSSSSSRIRKVFNVDVHDGAAEMKRKSVKEGESVALDTPEVKNPNNVMMWYFNDIPIAEITGDESKICEDDQCDERFRARLKLDHQTGSLTITNIRTTDSGLYKLQIKSSRNCYSITSILYKLQIKSSRNCYSITSIMSFSISVTDSGLSSAAVAGVCVVVGVLLVAAAAAAAGVIYYRYRHSRKDEGSPHDRRGSRHRTGANGRHSRTVPPQTGCCAPPFQSLAESESETE